MINILSIDSGTKTGWATLIHGSIDSGVQDFSLKRGESAGMRFFNFRSWLNRMLNKFKVDIVIYEQAHHRGGPATMIGVGLVTRIQEECDIREIQYMPLHSATLKKFATGKGNASKELMLKSARETWGDLVADDNEADALWLMEYARKEFDINET